MLLRDPVTHTARLFVPGGAIEQGETPAAAAVRETFEETGYRIACLPRAPLVARYPFTWAGSSIDVTTHFFAAALCDAARPPEPVNDATYNEGARWISLADVPQLLGFDSNIREAVEQLLLRTGKDT